ncbi:hypothetical protein F4781DRAFT_433679 [Annulohypoxylon bovei var. microspora]|nr:hypothetical protein F4781DRAFT_433679 [Annulohypoxylon bovei var. microspora]
MPIEDTELMTLLDIYHNPSRSVEPVPKGQLLVSAATLTGYLSREPAPPTLALRPMFSIFLFVGGNGSGNGSGAGNGVVVFRNWIAKNTGAIVAVFEIMGGTTITTTGNLVVGKDELVKEK